MDPGRTVLLLRHAHAAWGEAGGKDIDRPLSERGKREAEAIGRIMKHRDLVPDLVLCSTAQRTRQTFAIVAALLDCADRVRWKDRLYGSDCRAYVEIADEDRERNRLMVVGHNPMIEDFTELLSRTAEPEAARHLGYGFPTAGLAVVDVGTQADSFGEAQGHLRAFLTPKKD